MGNCCKGPGKEEEINNIEEHGKVDDSKKDPDFLGVQTAVDDPKHYSGKLDSNIDQYAPKTATLETKYKETETNVKENTLRSNDKKNAKKGKNQLKSKPKPITESSDKIEDLKESELPEIIKEPTDKIEQVSAKREYINKKAPKKTQLKQRSSTERTKEAIETQEQNQESSSKKERKNLRTQQTKESNRSRSSSSKKVKSSLTTEEGAEDYTTGALKLINKIRQDPQSFIPDIEEAIKKIEKLDGKTIYAGKVKVCLREGEPAFKEAIEALKQTEPMNPLFLKQNIIIPVPDDEDAAKQPATLKGLVENAKAQGKRVDGSFKDSVKDYYTSVLLLIIDDTGKNKGKKRKTILNKNYTGIGISYKKIHKAFTAYYTFSK